MGLLSRLYSSPVKLGLVVCGSIFLFGTSIGIIVGLLIIGSAECVPGDVCDGPAMAASALWFVSFWGSLILGLIVGSFSAFVLSRKEKERPKVVP